MGAWGKGPFESDGGLDEAFALLHHLAARVEQIACGTGADRSSVIRDEQELAADVELLSMVAEVAYRPAMFIPIRGLPLPDPKIVRGWRRKFLTRYERLARKQLEGTLTELRRYAREAAAPLERLAALAQRQKEMAEAMHRQVAEEVNLARRQEATDDD